MYGAVLVVLLFATSQTPSSALYIFGAVDIASVN